MLGQFALATAGLFAGAAVYVSVAEHPARMRLDDRAALAQWKPSYARGAVMQASLAALSGLVGLATWWHWGAGWDDWAWLAGAIAILANIPYTFAVVWGVNGRLKSTPIEHASPETRAMLERWARLHGVRTALGLAAVALFWLALR